MTEAAGGVGKSDGGSEKIGLTNGVSSFVYRLFSRRPPSLRRRCLPESAARGVKLVLRTLFRRAALARTGHVQRLCEAEILSASLRRFAALQSAIVQPTKQASAHVCHVQLLNLATIPNLCDTILLLIRMS